ncbi:MAG: hypothetical protein JKX81_14870 [Arenicella sp.]|nr:hypothetical protein [Arenicella sp.]
MWGIVKPMKVLAIVMMAAMISGCALSFVDKDGYEHSIGLIHQKVKLDGNLLYVQKSTVGLNVNLSQSDAGINLGYKNSYRVFVAQNMVLAIDKDGTNAIEIELPQQQ